LLDSAHFHRESFCSTSLFFLPRSHFGDFTTKSLQHRPYQGIAFKLRAQFLGTGCGNCCCRDRIKSSTDAHRTAQHVARNGTELFERFAPLDHFGERPLVRRKINSQLRAFEYPAAAVLHEFAEEFLLRLNGALDLRDLFLRDTADAHLLRADARCFAFRWSESCTLCRR